MLPNIAWGLAPLAIALYILHNFNTQPHSLVTIYDGTTAGGIVWLTNRQCTGTDSAV